MLLLSVLALWALVYDGLVLQTHRHPLHRPAAYDSPADRAVSADLDEACALCAAAAAFDPIVPVPPVTLLAAPASVAMVAVVAGHYPALLSRAHMWQSRAPPRNVSLH